MASPEFFSTTFEIKLSINASNFFENDFLDYLTGNYEFIENLKEATSGKSLKEISGVVFASAGGYSVPNVIINEN